MFNVGFVIIYRLKYKMTNRTSKIYTIKDVLQIFGSEAHRSSIIQAEKSGIIPTPLRSETGKISRRIWTSKDLPEIGQHYGFIKKPHASKCITVFTTKGGVLKTTLALNLARISAFHNIKTCIVGLDIQGDITNASGFNSGIDQIEDMQTAIEKMKQLKGIDSVFDQEMPLFSLLRPLDMPTLFIIPETAGLAVLDRNLQTTYHREYWLKENIVDQLKKVFDLIILDCSPNWNLLISNALVASDFLVSPIECRINQFRNLEVFQKLIEQFKLEMGLKFDHIYVPTRHTSTRKLSSEILGWYLVNIHNVSHCIIRESVIGEEAAATHLSVPEYASVSFLADEMRDLVKEIWKKTFLKTSTDIMYRKF